MDDGLLEQAISVAREAGAIILDYYDMEEQAVSLKDDNSPVTDADLASESYIAAELQRTGFPIISEECTCDRRIRCSWEQFWLVDPLDGTRDFISRNGEFTVNIAFIKNGSPILGVIYAPAIDTLYYAQKGKGSFLVKEGICKKLPISRTDVKLVTISRQHLAETGKKFLAMNNIKDFMQNGSSLKFGILAEGGATLYPRFEGSMEWDIAAGHIIATEAGCHIVDLKTGQEPVYNKESLFNNPFIAYAPQVKFSELQFPEY